MNAQEIRDMANEMLKENPDSAIARAMLRDTDKIVAAEAKKLKKARG